MPRSKQQPVNTDPHKLRLVQQVPAGTAGAYGPDPIMGAYWKATRRGLNGHGGFVSVETDRTLGDISQMTVLLAPNGSDGVSQADRFYCLPATEPGGGTYFPGDEWIEVYRGQSELVANGTPVDPHIDGSQGQVSLVCSDVMHLLKKTRETAGGFWVNAPRDVLEHYSRLWLPVMADDFVNALTEFPHAPNSGAGSTPDGRWTYDNCYALAAFPLQTYVRMSLNAAGTKGLTSAFTWPDGGANGHDCWRVEINVPQLLLGTLASGDYFFLQVNAGAVSPRITVRQPSPFNVTCDTGAVFVPGGASAIRPPFSLAIEARDRWYLFYCNGQLIGAAQRGTLTGGVAQLQVGITRPNAGSFTSQAAVDYVVVRRTSPPLNGGQSGDYVLPSPPAPGGLNGEYFDLAAYTQGQASELFGSPIMFAGAANQPQTRLDASLGFGAANPPSWQVAFLGAFGVRWTGSIYLPLATQDVHFALPASHATNSDFMRVWVGKTRAGEEVLTSWPGVTVVASSVGMRSLFGNVSGWYPIIIEYAWYEQNASPPWTGGADPGFTYDVGGAGTVPTSAVLSPLGVFHQQVRNDSHYDMFKTIADQFVYQFRTEPKQLESGSFPGAIVPYARVGRDTDYRLTDTEAISPTLDIKGEDVCSALLADASGLGGAGTGSLSIEAFNFAALAQHPFISAELENLPQHTFPAQLITNLLSLLGYRSAPWEDLQASSPGARSMQDTFPLTGQLAEFDWQPGDALLAAITAVFLKDAIPRQILTLKRLLYPDGMGDNVASFRPRIRSPQETLRRFVRQVYGARRTFQGQLVESSATPATSSVSGNGIAEVVLPNDLSLVRQATLVVLSKTDTTNSFTVKINGTTTFAITQAGNYDLGSYVAKNVGSVNGAPEPRMLIELDYTAGGSCTFTVQLRVLIPTA